jgi:hypothetical protein
MFSRVTDRDINVLRYGNTCVNIFEREGRTEEEKVPNYEN